MFETVSRRLQKINVVAHSNLLQTGKEFNYVCSLSEHRASTRESRLLLLHPTDLLTKIPSTGYQVSTMRPHVPIFSRRLRKGEFAISRENRGKPHCHDLLILLPRRPQKNCIFLFRRDRFCRRCMFPTFPGG